MSAPPPPHERAVKAVIFDVDGVLVDTGRLHLEAWRALARELGLPPPDERWFRRTFGRRNEEILKTLLPHPPSQGELERLSRRKEALFRRLAKGKIEPLPGALALVRALKRRGFRLGIGTSTPPENLQMILEELGLRGAFDAWVTGADVERGKPDPEVFLKAAARLGVPPARCAVIEDAPAGVEAAKRAGMRAVAVTTTAEPEALQAKGADLVVDSLRALTPERLDTLLEVQ